MIDNLLQQPLYVQVNFYLLVSSALFVTILSVYPIIYTFFFGEKQRTYEALPPIPTFRGSEFPINVDTILMLLYVGMTLMMIGSSCLELATPTQEKGESSAAVAWINAIFNFVFYLPLIIRYILAAGFSFSLTFTKLAATLLALISVYVCTGIINISGLPQWLVELTHTPETQHAVQMLTESSEGDSNTFLPTVISAVIIAPIVEEFFFRGFIFNILRKSTALLPAAIVSGFFFGAVHISLVQCIVLSAFGIIQCFLYDYTKSIVYPILMHMIFNALAVMALILTAS